MYACVDPWLIGSRLVRRFNDLTFEQGRRPEPVFQAGDVDAVVNSPEFYDIGRHYFTECGSRRAGEQQGTASPGSWARRCRVVLPGLAATGLDELALKSALGQTFEAALDRIRPAAQAIIKRLRALHDPPDEVKVEFGLKMNAEAGAVVASGGVEANYTVNLTWKREEKKPEEKKP